MRLKKISRDFENYLLEFSAGVITSTDFEKLINLFESEINNYYFTASSEANLIRIIQGMYDKVSFIKESIKYPHYIEILICIAANSNYLTDILVINPEYFYWVVNPSNLKAKLIRTKFSKELRTILVSYNSLQAKVNALKSTKRKELLRIGLKDIYLKIPIRELTEELSILAAQLSGELFATCYQQVLNKYKFSKTYGKYCLVALGKLGGEELNYSSDIDLILFYDKERKINRRKYFSEILIETTQMFLKSSAEITGGFLYRVDFRLRPDGRNSPLCRSIQEFLDYYESRGEDWERQMLIKAGFLSGSKSLYNKFINYLLPFVFPSSFAISPKKQILKMKENIERQNKDEENIKLSYGGIRDIAVIEKIESLKKEGRPVLVGTTSVEVSETLSRMLKRKRVAHNVLNAKQHQNEAEIVAHAGEKGAITIATNMAGRGTDIKLGAGVVEKDGLFILGTERHDSRRIDRQLRGRSGRQGDPGTSKFYLSLEDDLMRLFGSDRISSVMERIGIQEGEVIQHPMITKSVERAQKKVEENNFAIRKRLLEYDDTMNQQREVIYTRRNRALEGERLKGEIFDLLDEYADDLIDRYFESVSADSIREELLHNLLVEVKLDPEEFETLGEAGVKEKIIIAAKEFYKRKEEMLGSELMSRLERFAMLSVIDHKWKEHLREMDDLKEGIGLRAYGQKDPLVEYKGEAFKLFISLIEQVRNDVVSFAFKFFPQAPDEVQRQRQQDSGRMIESKQATTNIGYSGGSSQQAQASRRGKVQPVKVGDKVGRNEPCPCGSGKKYKHCHGK